MNKLQLGRFVLIGFNLVYLIGCFLLTVISQVGLISFALLALLYFFSILALLSFDSLLRKMYLYPVLPTSVLTVWNVAAFGGANYPAYFRTPGGVKIIIVIVMILLPLIFNVLYLINPNVKSRFK